MSVAEVVRISGERAVYWCAGCKDWHSINIGMGDGARWQWNGDKVKPTFSPSVLVRSGHFAPSFDPATDHCWCVYNAEQVAKGEPPVDFSCSRCHTFIMEGMVEFLGDCSHALAGKTLPMPELPEP